LTTDRSIAARAHRYIQAARVVEALSPIGDKTSPVPTNEAQARELTKLLPEEPPAIDADGNEDARGRRQTGSRPETADALIETWSAVVAAAERDGRAITAEFIEPFVLDRLKVAREPLVVGRTDPDEVPAVERVVVRRWEVYALGEHRLHVGNSTFPGHVARLMDGEQAAVLWTDPPYGVQYFGKTKQRMTISGDDSLWTPIEGTRNAAAMLVPGGSFYICVPSAPRPSSDAYSVFRHLQQAELLHSEDLVWIKDRFVLGHADYHWQHEKIMYGWKLGASHRWFGDRRQSTTLGIARVDGELQHTLPRPAQSHEHPTMKPVELIQGMLWNSSRPGDIVLDPFVGSGSTIIAAEQLRRRCFAMELDPTYAQRAIRRWEAFTGKKAKRIARFRS
jgi:DNA modification methylase